MFNFPKFFLLVAFLLLQSFWSFSDAYARQESSNFYTYPGVLSRYGKAQYNQIPESQINNMLVNEGNIDQLILNLERRARSTTNYREAREIRYLITQLIETKKQIARTKNTLMQMQNLRPDMRYPVEREEREYRRRGLDRYGYIQRPEDRRRRPESYESYTPSEAFDEDLHYQDPERDRRSHQFQSLYNDIDMDTINPAYFVDDSPVVGATDLQIKLEDSNMYDVSVEDFVNSRLPSSRVSPYSSDLQLSEAGKQIIKARLELAEYLFFNNLKARGLFVVRDLLRSISVEDSWTMQQLIKLGDELASKSNHRDVAVHIFRLGFKKYRGLPVAAQFLIRAGMVSYYIRDIKDACLSFMTVRDGYPYDKKFFVHADVMAKKLKCPPQKVQTTIIW